MNGDEGDSHDMGTGDFFTGFLGELLCDGDDFWTGDEKRETVGVVSEGLGKV